MEPWYLDTECYINYWLLMFMREDGRTKSFELYDGHPLDVEGVRRFLFREGVEIITFNGIKYDEPMISLALSGATTQELKRVSNDIIDNNLKPWDFEVSYGVSLVKCNHIDLVELAPGIAGLKTYAGRLHCAELQDLPFEPDAEISADDRVVLRTYCVKDLKNTQALAHSLRPNIDIRRVVSGQIDLDVRSKSDAQISEAVFKRAFHDAHGYWPKRRGLMYSSFYYVPPEHIQFGADNLCAVLDVLRSAKMEIDSTGHVIMPEAIDNLVITIGDTRYKMGIGGLHSQESEVSHYASGDIILKDIDVESYYPKMIVNVGMYPDALGPLFQDKYDNIRIERIEAKHAGDKVKSDVFKIVLNGAFGKTSSKYSILYNPKMMIYTTLTGQLNILMLIEALERYEIKVVSANTDGIVVKCPTHLDTTCKTIVRAWEKLTNLATEEAVYKSLHSRDVNSYVAVKPDGKVKTKGAFAPTGLSKNPQNAICIDAVVKFLTHQMPVEDTVRSCLDITKFLTLRRVGGGAVKQGYTLGKVVRWYYAVGETGVINDGKTGNTVARSEGAVPLMDLPPALPDDIDYDWYIRECNSLLMGVGATPRPPVVKLPRKNSKAWRVMVENGLIVVA